MTSEQIIKRWSMIVEGRRITEYYIKYMLNMNLWQEYFWKVRN